MSSNSYLHRTYNLRGLTHEVIGVCGVQSQKVFAVPNVRSIAKNLLLVDPRLNEVLAVVTLTSVASLGIVHALRCELLASSTKDDLRRLGVRFRFP